MLRQSSINNSLFRASKIPLSSNIIVNSEKIPSQPALKQTTGKNSSDYIDDTGTDFDKISSRNVAIGRSFNPKIKQDGFFGAISIDQSQSLDISFFRDNYSQSIQNNKYSFNESNLRSGFYIDQQTLKINGKIKHFELFFYLFQFYEDINK